MAARNGLPSREALEERPSNLYVQGLPKTTANQNRQLPPPPDEDEEGYMAPSHLAKSDVTSPLLRGEEQTKDEKYSHINDFYNKLTNTRTCQTVYILELSFHMRDSGSGYIFPPHGMKN